MWTDSLGNVATLEGDASVAALNDFVEGFIASEARAVNILVAATHDPSPIVQACAAAVHMFAESADAPAPEGGAWGTSPAGPDPHSAPWVRVVTAIKLDFP